MLSTKIIYTLVIITQVLTIFANQVLFLMKKVLKLFFSLIALVLLCSSCEKACICTVLDNGSSEILWGVYSQKECETYTDYYQSVYNADNVECEYKLKK